MLIASISDPEYDPLTILNESGAEDVGKFDTIGSVLGFGFNLAMGVGVSATLLCAGYGVILLVLSQGEPKATKKGRDAIIWAIIGLVITLGAWAFKQIVLNTAGANYEDITGN
jgi:hypothetical protein